MITAVRTRAFGDALKGGKAPEELARKRNVVSSVRSPLPNGRSSARTAVKGDSDGVWAPASPKANGSQDDKSGRQAKVGSDDGNPDTATLPDALSTRRTKSTKAGDEEEDKGGDPAWKRRAPNYGRHFESNLYVPRSLCLVHRDDTVDSNTPQPPEDSVAAATIAVSGSGTEHGPSTPPLCPWAANASAVVESGPAERAAVPEGASATAALEGAAVSVADESRDTADQAATEAAPTSSPRSPTGADDTSQVEERTIPPIKKKKRGMRTTFFEDIDSAREQMFRDWKAKREAKEKERQSQLEKEAAELEQLKTTSSSQSLLKKKDEELKKPDQDQQRKEQEKRLDELPRAIYELVSKYLCDPKGIPPNEYISGVAQIGRTTNFVSFKFNMIVGNLKEAYFFSSTSRERVVYSLSPGEYGLTASPLLNPEWPKMLGAKAELQKLLSRDVSPATYIDELFGILACQKRHDPDSLPSTGVGDELEVLLSPMFVADKAIPNFATRSCTVAIIDREKIYHYHREYVGEQRNRKTKGPEVGILPQSDGSPLSSVRTGRAVSKKWAGGSARRRHMTSFETSVTGVNTDEDSDEEERRYSDSDYDPDDLDIGSNEGLPIPSPLRPSKTVVHITSLVKTEPLDDEAEVPADPSTEVKEEDQTDTKAEEAKPDSKPSGTPVSTTTKKKKGKKAGKKTKK